MVYLTAILAADTAEHHHVDWTAIASVRSLIARLAALILSLAAIVVAGFSPWIGYTKARLELLTEKLEKVYQLVKEEWANPFRLDDSLSFNCAGRDFRTFQAGNAELEVLTNLSPPQRAAAFCSPSIEFFVPTMWKQPCLQESFVNRFAPSSLMSWVIHSVLSASSPGTNTSPLRTGAPGDGSIPSLGLGPPKPGSVSVESKSETDPCVQAGDPDNRIHPVGHV